MGGQRNPDDLRRAPQEKRHKPVPDGSKSPRDNTDRFWAKFTTRKDRVILLSLLVGVAVISVAVTSFCYRTKWSSSRFLPEATRTIGVELYAEASVFQNDLKISVTKITKGSDGYHVFATLKKADEEPGGIIDAKPPAEIKYPKENGYKVKVLLVNEGTATFEISPPSAAAPN